MIKGWGSSTTSSELFNVSKYVKTTEKEDEIFYSCFNTQDKHKKNHTSLIVR